MVGFAVRMAIMACSVNGAIIEGPLPMTVVAPIGGTVELTCVVNISDLMAQTGLGLTTILWNTESQVSLSSARRETKGGTSTLRVELTAEFTSGVSVRCAILLTNLTRIFSNISATLIAYGTYTVVYITFSSSLHIIVIIII